MQNLLSLAPGIANTDGFGAATGRGKVGLVDGRDVAAVAAEIASSPHQDAGKTYRLTGPELLSYYDIAATLSALLGRTVSYRELTMDENRDAMIRAGVPEAVAQMNAEAFSLIAAGDAAWLSDDVQSLLGRPPRSFAQFAADYTSVFSAPAS